MTKNDKDKKPPPPPRPTGVRYVKDGINGDKQKPNNKNQKG